jgi:two-component system, LuxR family, sensor kinase FixL
LDSTFNQDFFSVAQRLNAIFEAALDGIITIDERGIMEVINPAAAIMFGYESDELIGKNVSMLMPDMHARQHDQYLQNYLQTGHKRIIGIGREVEGRRKNGTLFPLRLSVSEVKTEGRSLFTGTLHDLTLAKEAEDRIIRLNAELEQRVDQRTEELAGAVNQLLNINKKLEHEIQERRAVEAALRHSEQELRRAYEKEKELSELKSRFVTMASHEFRTPLSAILSSADLIEAYLREDQQPKRVKHTARIKSAVANLIGILNDFLSLSKLEEGKVGVQPVRFLLSEFCTETLDDLNGLLKPGQQIHHNMPPDDLHLFLDKKVLKNIFFNLLSNAIKYSDAGKPIDCDIRLDNEMLYITVTDQGIGIPLEEQQHIFTRFFRAHNAENIQGTGLGLNIVKRYVELLRGSINFESDLGKGTTFRLAIPLAQTN